MPHPHFFAVLCDYSMAEMRRVYNRKFPNKLSDFERFAALLMLSVTMVLTPPDEEAVQEENSIRDLKDRPILRAAIAEKVDAILTGDKDFLESGITQPEILTAAEFLQKV